MIKTGLQAAMLLALAAGLGGCVFAIGDGDGDNGYHKDAHTKTEERNRSLIGLLPLGATLADVQVQLGTPDFSEALRGKDGEYRVLRYRTQHLHSDGDTTRDETTALVFLNGKLSGIGETAYAKLLAG
ncbi:MAG: hypothetical protein JWQ90_1039 [Hydrocarboniphaga sp.]|uniref:DUF3192 domain-containing protein n=1 Tax=Hydrocarboniphaga sp. TaxID=2033016 RepID=UPI002627280E|nr:DUF3192 domain-containing protein [Hydrocarboniphaga sp.]MDB5968589.1 hypothetical protein [Hydrocarboniphaga sp.]